MEDYKPNSHRSKENPQSTEKKKVEKVVHGAVKTRKRSGMDKVKDALISDDAANIKSYVVMDVLVPAVKKAISDIVTNGIEMILYGETNRKRSPGTTVSYRNFYEQKNRNMGYSSSPVARGYTYNDVELESRGEAEEVLYRMDELIATYGAASVADLYDLVGITGQYTDNKYGWTNIRNAEIVGGRGCYRIKLPKALPID